MHQIIVGDVDVMIQLADAGVLRAGHIEGSGLARPARVVLDTGRAAALGVACRPVSAVLGAA